MPAAPRHVGVNALFLEPGRSAGPETYLRGLVPALAREYATTRFTVVTTRKGADALVRDGWTDFCAVLKLRADEGERLARLRAEQLSFPVLGARRGWDVLHSLASVAPVRTRTAHVITLHDVNFFHHRTFNTITTAGMRAIVASAARHADALLTGAVAARDDIVATLGIPPERIAVVPHGAGRPPDVEPRPAAEVRRRHALPEGARVVLCVAAIRPHKNQGLLVRALPLLPADVIVVLAGHAEPYVEEIEALAADLGVAERLRVVGYVDDTELEGLWALAGCAAFPTLGEGFGLPVVEALGRGLPVACSDIPVLREVGGPHPSYFAPDDPRAAAAALQAALSRPHDAADARAWVGRFTWEAAARGTFAAYERALAART